MLFHSSAGPSGRCCQEDLPSRPGFSVHIQDEPERCGFTSPRTACHNGQRVRKAQLDRPTLRGGQLLCHPRFNSCNPITELRYGPKVGVHQHGNDSLRRLYFAHAFIAEVHPCALQIDSRLRTLSYQGFLNVAFRDNLLFAVTVQQFIALVNRVALAEEQMPGYTSLVQDISNRPGIPKRILKAYMRLPGDSVNGQKPKALDPA